MTLWNNRNSQLVIFKIIGPVLSSADRNNQMHQITGPGHWNDPNMLQVGNVGLALIEAKSHFSL